MPPPIPSSTVGPGEAELGEEDPRERVVVVLAGVHEDLLVALAQRPGHGGRLDELRPVADDGEDLHALSGGGADDRGRPVDHRGRTHHVAVHAELLRLEAERQADELGQVQDRHLELAAHDPLGERLLQVEVQVAERTGQFRRSVIARGALCQNGECLVLAQL